MDVELNLAALGTSDVTRANFMRSLALVSGNSFAKVSTYRVFNEDLYNAYITAITGNPDEARLRGLIVLNTTPAYAQFSTLLHIDFVAPPLLSLDAVESSVLRKDAQQFVSDLKITSADSRFTRPLPVIGLTDSLPPAQRDPQQQFTLANLSDVDKRIQLLLSALANAPADMNSIESLAARLSSVSDVQKVTWSENEDRIDFQVQLTAASNKSVKLQLGEDARNKRISSPSNLPEAIVVRTTVNAALTIGLDRTAVATSGKPVLDLSIDSLSVRAVNLTPSSTPPAPPIPAFDLKIGMLDARVTGTTVNFDAQATLSRSAIQPRITVDAISANGRSIAGMLTADGTGHAHALLSVSADFAGLPAANIQLRQNNVFAGDPQVEFGTNSCLAAWSNYGTELLNDVLRNVENTLGDIERMPLLNPNIQNGLLPPFNQLVPLSNW